MIEQRENIAKSRRGECYGHFGVTVAAFHALGTGVGSSRIAFRKRDRAELAARSDALMRSWRIATPEREFR